MKAATLSLCLFMRKNRRQARPYQLRGKMSHFFPPLANERFPTPSRAERAAATRTFRPFSHSLCLILSPDSYSRSSRGRKRKRERELNKSNKKLINKEEEFSLALSRSARLPVAVSTLSHPSQFLRMSPRTPVAVAHRAATTKRET